MGEQGMSKQSNRRMASAGLIFSVLLAVGAIGVTAFLAGAKGPEDVPSPQKEAATKATAAARLTDEAMATSDATPDEIESRTKPTPPTAVGLAPKPPKNRYMDLIAGGEMMESQTIEQTEGVDRIRVYKTGFKYPYIRVVEQIARDERSGTERVTSRKAMVADHVIVKVKPGTTEQDIQRLAGQIDATVKRKTATADTYLLQLREPSVDAVSEAIELFSKDPTLITAAEPDYVI
jgi:hypothetical protein